MIFPGRIPGIVICLKKGKFCDEAAALKDERISRFISPSPNELMKCGYARVSSEDRNPGCKSRL
jgi:hypothetical protein